MGGLFLQALAGKKAWIATGPWTWRKRRAAEQHFSSKKLACF